VVVEDLNVAGMLRNRRLARSIADAGFGEIRRQLTYKTGWHGGRLVVADRWFPSSKRRGAYPYSLTRNGLFYRHKLWKDWIASHEAALTAAREVKDAYGVATILGSIAVAYREQRRYAEADACFQESITIWKGLDDRYGQAWTGNNLAYACRE
jgi:Tetratricopeptide repeat